MKVFIRVLECAMISERMEQLFERNGYSKVPSNLPEFTFYYRRENQGTVVIHVIDYRQGLYISEDQFGHLKQKITEFMHSKGEREVHLLSLILCDDIGKAKQLSIRESFCWMIDTANRRLIIHENQVGDFYGWRGILEEFLLHPEDACGEEAANREENIDGEEHLDSKFDKVRNRAWLRELPWTNICLIGVNVIVFLICTFTGRMLYNKGALGVLMVIEDKSYYRIITSMFLHADTGHLFSNMIILYYAGEIVERKMGHFLYAVLYFLSGIAGGMLSMGYELLSGDYVSSVGASGAVFGVEGALLLLIIFHHGKLESVTFGRMVFVILFSLYCGFTSTDVNNAAHIGGVLMGFALAAVFWLLRPYMRAGKDGDFNEN